VASVPWSTFLKKLSLYLFRIVGWPSKVPPPGGGFALKNLATLYLVILADSFRDGTLKTEMWTDGLFSSVLFP
jgi:hypothetical protein